MIELTNEFTPTALGGYITASYAELERLLGPPNAASDGYKVSTEWTLSFNGAIYTLYDYKETNFYDDDLPSVDEFRALPNYDWHVGSPMTDGQSTRADEFIVALRTMLTRQHDEG